MAGIAPAMAITMAIRAACAGAMTATIRLRNVLPAQTQLTQVRHRLERIRLLQAVVHMVAAVVVAVELVAVAPDQAEDTRWQTAEGKRQKKSCNCPRLGKKINP